MLKHGKHVKSGALCVIMYSEVYWSVLKVIDTVAVKIVARLRNVGDYTVYVWT